MEAEMESHENDDETKETETPDEEGEERISRPSTPSMPIFDILPKNEDEWWRPSHPPETYMWEEVRRKRQRGGYPWTLLDKDDEIDVEDYLDDNLYEPVNPPPLYGTGSSYMAGSAKDQHETGSLDGRTMIDIPPDIEIVNSEGLDGLDQPDPHDRGVDGDKEWMHSDDEHVSPPKVLFTAGIRNRNAAKVPDTATSSIRPLTNKNTSFTTEAPTTIEGEAIEDEEIQEVPTESQQPQPGPSPARKTTTAFEKLKNKAAGAADQVKQRFNKIGLPVRPKLNQWEGVKLARKRPKKKSKVQEPEQEVPDEEEVQEPMDESAQPEQVPEEAEQVQEKPAAVEEEQVVEPEEEEVPEVPAMSAKEAKAEALRKEKEAAAEEKLRKQKEQEEIKRQKAEEKQRKQKEQEELKRQKAEEEQRKQKEQEELKRQKAEEEQKAKEELQKKKAEEKAAKQKAAEEAKKAAEEVKKAKLEEQLAKAREAEEQRRLKEEEELQRIREQEEAKKFAAQAAASMSPEVVQEEAEENVIPPEEEEVPEVPQTATPTGTTKRKVKKMTFPQLPQLPQMPKLPHIDLDFKRKVIKRSKTPPARPQPPRMKFPRRGVEETENQLASQYENEIEIRKIEMEQEDEEPQAGGSSGLREPQIYVTQPSSEPTEEAATHVNWEPPQQSSSTTTKDAEIEEEEIEESAPGARKQPAAKERLDKFGKSLKGFGAKSKEVASQKSKAMGEKMKVIGKDLQKFGVKVNERYQATIEEIKAKQEAAKTRTKQKAKEAEDIDDNIPMEVEYESATEPRRKFRFRRRDESQDEQEEEPEHKDSAYYENSEEVRTQTEQDVKTDEGRITRSQLLGRADRDWESPLDLAQSRDRSEDRYSANASSRDSPPGSSMASSTFAHVRKQGVLEEIDSDEFFLREKGISEGEDEEEINRFLVEELRQAFRPQVSNALADFDLPSPPQRPERLPRKPQRKEKGDQSPTYQTFPPERPRRKAPGYVSAYMQDHPDDMEEDQGSNEEERGSPRDQEEELDEDGARRVKEELQRLEQEDREQRQEEEREEYEDDGRYEPISDEPVKPQRTKKRQAKPSTPVYYNTVAGNEWMRELEEQVHVEESPKPPQRERRKSSQSRSVTQDVDESTQHFSGDATQSEGDLAPRSTELQSLTQTESESRVDDAEVDIDDNLEYVDEAGYAVVHKEREPPRTTPRKKKRSTGSSKGSSKGSSLKRQSPEQQQQASENEPAFFSLPRYTPRTFHIVPPSRPQRNYSTLRPRRPPRHKSNQNLGKGKGEKDDGPRPSTAIGIMQNRPLPPPPRPDRSPVPLNDLDQTSIERAVGARHYANFDDREAVEEEVFTATNIPVLGRREQQSSSTMAAGDINIGIQTDPFQEAELDIEAAIRSYEEESSRVEKQSDSLRTNTSFDRETRQERPRSPAPPPRETQPPQYSTSQPQFVFPRRLHLDELEVDVLRVNDLSAHSITVEHLQAPQLEVNSLTSVGPLTVSSIHTQTLNSDQINCNRLSTDTADLPSVIPATFFQLSSPDQPVQPPQREPTQTAPPPVESAEELRLETAEREDAENESAYPYRQDSTEYFETPYENLSNAATDPSDYQKESSPTNEFNRCASDAGYCLTPEEPAETEEDNWERYALSEEFSKASEQFEASEPYNEYLSTEPCEDFAKYSESQLESSMPSEDFLKSAEEPSESCIPPQEQELEQPETEFVQESEQLETGLIQESEKQEPELIQKSEQEEAELIQESEQKEPELIQESYRLETELVQESEEPELDQESYQLETEVVQESTQPEPELIQELETEFVQESTQPEPELIQELETEFVQESTQPEPELIQELETEFVQESEQNETVVVEETEQVLEFPEEISKSFDNELMNEESSYGQFEETCPPENEREQSPVYETEISSETQDQVEGTQSPSKLRSSLDDELQDSPLPASPAELVFSSESEPEEYNVLKDEPTHAEEIESELKQTTEEIPVITPDSIPRESEVNLENVSRSTVQGSENAKIKAETPEKCVETSESVPKEPLIVPSVSAPSTSTEQSQRTPERRDIQSQPAIPAEDIQQGQDEDIMQLSIRLGRALTRLTMRGLQAIIDYVDTATSDDPAKSEQQRANLQVLLCVLLILIAGILLSSSHSSGSSHPRWEFLMPPDL